jgi:hypothetical protein
MQYIGGKVIDFYITYSIKQIHEHFTFENDKINTIDRVELKIPLNPVQLVKNQKSLGDFSQMNKTWSVSNSKNTHDRLLNNKEEWFYYHTLYSEKRKTWLEIPYIEISKKIKIYYYQNYLS